MSARIEARRLSGVDIGKTVVAPDGKSGVLVGIQHGPHTTSFQFTERPGAATGWRLAPSDLVTVTGRGQS